MSMPYPEPKEDEKRPIGATPWKFIDSYRFTKKELQDFITYMEEEGLDEMNIPVLDERKVT